MTRYVLLKKLCVRLTWHVFRRVTFPVRSFRADISNVSSTELSMRVNTEFAERPKFSDTFMSQNISLYGIRKKLFPSLSPHFWCPADRRLTTVVSQFHALRSRVLPWLPLLASTCLLDNWWMCKFRNIWWTHMMAAYNNRPVISNHMNRDRVSYNTFREVFD